MIHGLDVNRTCIISPLKVESGQRIAVIRLCLSVVQHLADNDLTGFRFVECLVDHKRMLRRRIVRKIIGSVLFRDLTIPAYPQILGCSHRKSCAGTSAFELDQWDE